VQRSNETLQEIGGAQHKEPELRSQLESFFSARFVWRGRPRPRVFRGSIFTLFEASDSTVVSILGPLCPMFARTLAQTRVAHLQPDFGLSWANVCATSLCTFALLTVTIALAQNGTPSSKATAAINTAVGCTYSGVSNIGGILPASCHDIFNGAAVDVTPDSF